MVNEIAAMSVAAINTFCSGKRRASPSSEVAAASNQNKPSSQRHSSANETPSSSVTQATAKQTRNAMNTGLCLLCAQGEGNCASPPANTSVEDGLNSGFIADSIPREMSEIKQRGFWKRNSVYFVGAGLAYIGAFGINFIGGNSSLEARTGWGLGWGILMWPFYLVSAAFDPADRFRAPPLLLDTLYFRRLLIV